MSWGARKDEHASWGRDARVDFPLQQPQSCAFCGSPNWVIVYPLLTISPERARASIALPWFWCACQRCADLVDSGDWDALAAIHAASDWGADDAVSVVSAFRAWRSPASAIPRAAALARRPSLRPDTGSA